MKFNKSSDMSLNKSLSEDFHVKFIQCFALRTVAKILLKLMSPKTLFNYRQVYATMRLRNFRNKIFSAHETIKVQFNFTIQKSS